MALASAPYEHVVRRDVAVHVAASVDFFEAPQQHAADDLESTPSLL